MKYHNYDTESNYYKIKANSMKELDWVKSKKLCDKSSIYEI